MPKSWTVLACCPDSVFFTPNCPFCKLPGEYVGWTRTKNEQMAIYQYVYGLKPRGPHLGLADRLLGSTRKCCYDCRGTGITVSERPADRRPCPHCEGTGGSLAISQEEFDALRQRVLDAFLEAEMKHPTSHFLGADVLFSLGRGEAFSARDKPRPAKDTS
jgi:hypothetical protein